MGKRDPRVDAYIQKSAPFAQPILTHIREAVHEGCPEIEEDMKWSAPAFMYKGILCGMASFKRHCAFGFWKSALLGGPQGSKGTGARGQYARLESIKELPSKRELVRLVKQAKQLNHEGIKTPKRPAARTREALPIPSDFMDALRRNKKALGTFENFSPSQRREYIEWITEAKTDATRTKRRATAVEWLSEGKVRNWKYVPAS